MDANSLAIAFSLSRQGTNPDAKGAIAADASQVAMRAGGQL